MYRFLYNAALEQRIFAYKILQDVVRRLDRAFDFFFRRIRLGENLVSRGFKGRIDMIALPILKVVFR